METNIPDWVLTMAAQRQTPAANQNGILIVSMILAAVAPTLASLGAYFKAQAALDTTNMAHAAAVDSASIARCEALECSKIAHEAVKEHTADLKEIHKEVNSSRTVMEAELKTLRTEVLRISSENSALIAKERAREIFDAKMQAPPQPAVSPPATPSV